MKIDVYTATGTKKGTVELPKALFEIKPNKGLMYLALLRQQNNRRLPIAHVKTRGEVTGSTRKLYQQKGTGRARRGSANSPILRGGGKAFGPRNKANYKTDMPRKMRRNALFSCLSLRAKEGAILGLENYPDDVKTKTLSDLLKKMSLPLGRKLVIVLPGARKGLELSARNIPNVKTLKAQYLNPEDILGASHLIFLVDAIKVAEETFGEKNAKKEKSAKNAANKKNTTKITSAKNEKSATNEKSTKKATNAKSTKQSSQSSQSLPSS